MPTIPEKQKNGAKKPRKKHEDASINRNFKLQFFYIQSIVL